MKGWFHSEISLIILSSLALCDWFIMGMRLLSMAFCLCGLMFAAASCSFIFNMSLASSSSDFASKLLSTCALTPPELPIPSCAAISFAIFSFISIFYFRLSFSLLISFNHPYNLCIPLHEIARPFILYFIEYARRVRSARYVRHARNLSSPGGIHK